MYAKELAKTLLTASGFSNSPWNLASNLQDPHRYYIDCQTVTEAMLCQDQWDYMVSQGDKIRNRCVIFLIKAEGLSPSGVVLWLSEVDAAARHLLINLFSEDTKKRAAFEKPFSQQVLTQTQRVALSSLYRRIESWLVGSGQISMEAARLGAYLQRVYTNARCQIQVQPIDPNQQTDIVFAESLLRLGHQKPLGTMDIAQILTSHQALCHQLLQRWWSEIKNDQPTVFRELETLTRQLLKYAALQGLRQTYATRMPEASYEQLHALFSQDQTQKSRIYGAALSDILPLLKQLSFPTMVGLLAYRQPLNLPGLVQLLQGECQKQQGHIKQWEKDLAKLLTERRWLRRSDVAYFVAEQVYQYSLIGLGAELTPILSVWGLKVVGLEAKFEQLSPVQQRRFLMGLKIAGGGLGAYFTTISGTYWLAKSFLIGNASHWMNNVLEMSRLEDNTATVRGPFPLGKIGWSRCLHLGIAAMESLGYGRMHHFTQALGGVVGSVSSVSLATRWFAQGMPHQQPLSADLAAFSFFCSVAGYDIGQFFAGTAHQGIDKLATREALSNVFCDMVAQKNYQACVTDFSANSAWSPSFWLRVQDTVRLGWQNGAGFQESECEIVPLSSGDHGVVCDAPVTLAVKRLG